MATYIGYYRVTEGFAEENGKRARSGDKAIDQKFGQMIIELPGKLPNGINIIGSYAPMAGPVLGNQPPSVMIVDAAETSDLTFISQYYSGYLQFQWMPASVVGASRAQRESWRAQTAEPAAVR
jgi:hypothetical protein